MPEKPKMEEQALRDRCHHAAAVYIKKIGMERANLADKTAAANNFFSGFYAGVRFTEDYPEAVCTKNPTT